MQIRDKIAEFFNKIYPILNDHIGVISGVLLGGVGISIAVLTFILIPKHAQPVPLKVSPLSTIQQHTQSYPAPTPSLTPEVSRPPFLIQQGKSAGKVNPFVLPPVLIPQKIIVQNNLPISPSGILITPRSQGVGNQQSVKNSPVTQVQVNNTGSSGQTQVTIAFQGVNGQIQTYTPPAIPPVSVTWGLYANTQDNYSIEYPTNWQVFKIIDSGHEGLSIYPPDSSDTSQYAAHLGLGVSSFYSIPSSGDGAIYASNIIVDSILGTLYTRGAEGNSYVASFFLYHNNYFGLGSSVSSPELLYVFAHMIYSLKFNQ